MAPGFFQFKLEEESPVSRVCMWSLCLSDMQICSFRMSAVAKKPLAAPSANRFGHISPTLPDHVLEARPCHEFLKPGGLWSLKGEVHA